MQTPITAFAPRRCLHADLFSGSVVSTDPTTVLFVDLAGFTSLTESLAPYGSRGTEQLSEVIGNFFSKTTGIVLESGGDLLAYGGDALTIAFDGSAQEALGRAQQVADSIHGDAEVLSGRETLAGKFHLSARVGIARGLVSTAVAHSDERAIPVHLGTALDEAVSAESTAQGGSTVISPSALVTLGVASVVTSGAPVTSTARASIPSLEKLLHPNIREHVERGAPLPTSHRTVSVAFIGFPPVSTDDIPEFQERVARLLTIVTGNGGEVVQVSGGDKGVVAFVLFGAPVAHDNDPLRATQAMLELRNADPSIRVGIASGPVFATYLGSADRKFSAHFGRAVNMAARLMQHASETEVLVSPGTWESTSSYLRQQGTPMTLSLKGLAKPVQVRSVAGWRTRRNPAVPHPLLPILGRTDELDTAERFLNKVSSGQSVSLSIRGEPGVGKSRLAQEIVERAKTRRLRVLTVDADDYPHTQQHRIWRQLLHDFMRVTGNPKQHATLELLRQSGVSEQQLPLIAQVIGSGPQGSTSPTASREVEQELALEGYARLVTSGEEPTLIVAENDHLLDTRSLALLKRLSAGLADSKTAILTVGRSPASQTLPRHEGSKEMALLELELTAAGQLARDYWHHLGGGAAPTWLAEFAVARAGGNPLLLQISTRRFLSQWQPGSPPPRRQIHDDSPSALLVEQVDSLPLTQANVFAVLTSSSSPVSVDMVSTALDSSQSWEDTATALDNLEEARWVRRVTQGEQIRYRVRHESLKGLAYERLSHARRKEIHASLATELIADNAGPREIAEHVLHLDDADLAKTWYPLAAIAARSAWLIPEAIEWWERSLPLVTSNDRNEAVAGLLEDLVHGGRPSEAFDRADDLVKLIEPHDAPALLSPDSIRVHLAVAEAALACGLYERAEGEATAILAASSSSMAQDQRANELLVVSLSERGNFAAAVATARRQVVDAERSSNDGSVMIAYASLGAALYMSGEFAEAESCYEAAREIATRVGDVVYEIHTLSDLAGCSLELGDVSTCLRRLADARSRAEAIGYRRHLAFSLTNEASVRIALGDPYGASCERFAFDRSMELGDLTTAAHALQYWFMSATELRDDPEVIVRLTSISESLGREQVAVHLGAQLALSAAKNGRLPEFSSEVDRAVGQNDELPAPVLRKLKLAEQLDAGFRQQGRDRKTISHQIGALLNDPDVGEVEGAELAVEAWRVQPDAVTQALAVAHLLRAFEVEPSSTVRSWFAELGMDIPTPPEPLPPPVGIATAEATRSDAIEALQRLEAAVGVSPA